MKINFFLLLSRICILKAVMFDSGNSTNMYYPHSCLQGQTRTASIPFNKAFTNIPKVAIFPMSYDINTQCEFTFKIGNITKTCRGFIYLLEFDYLTSCIFNSVSQFGFYWRAIDDWRIEVIDSFNTNVSNLGNTSFTFSYNNVNVVKGFVIPINFGFTGEIYFQLDISSLTSNQVVISLTQNTTNLLSLGFQVFLGHEESYFTETPQTKFKLALTSPSYIYTNIQQQTGYQLFMLIKFLNNPYQSYGTRLDLINIMNDNNTISYSVRTWYYTKIASISYQFVWMNQKVFQPLLLKKMRQTRMFSFYQTSEYITIQIPELISSYSQTGSYSITIDKTIQNLTLLISVYCYNGMKVSGSILKCLTCNIQSQSWQQNCYPDINSLNYYIRLYQIEKINQQIQLTLTSTSVKIYQSDVNQVGSTNYTVLALELSNI